MIAVGCQNVLLSQMLIVAPAQSLNFTVNLGSLCEHLYGVVYACVSVCELASVRLKSFKHSQGLEQR